MHQEGSRAAGMPNDNPANAKAGGQVVREGARKEEKRDTSCIDLQREKSDLWSDCDITRNRRRQKLPFREDGNAPWVS
mgnify:CR=1 FL=1